MPIARRLALLCALLASLVVPLASARAADVPRLQGHILDDAGALTDRTTEVQAALDELLRGHDVELFVVFVDTTSPMTATEFADETARVNSLGANDALLLVAMGDRTDAIWVSTALAPTLTDPELNQVIADSLEPALRDGDAAGAVIATAQALGLAAAPEPAATKPVDGGGPVDGGPNDGGIPVPSGGPAIDPLAALGVVFLVVGLAIAGWWLATRVAARREAEERDRETGRLAREANAALLAMDERTRTADQEAGFVEAEFGEDQAAPFRAAIAEARTELRAAFGVRQRLDDATPEDPPTRAAMLREIVERCGRAETALDRQAARIKELRDLEQHAGPILAALPARVAEQERRLEPTGATLERLQAYAESAWTAVRGNVAEAGKGLTGARAAIDRGTAAMARSDTRGAAREIATAQEGIAGALAMLDAVDKLAASIDDAKQRLPAELQAAQADLAAARQAIAGAPTGTSAAPLPAAEAAIKAATDSAATIPADPVAAYRLAAAARRASADALAAVRQDAAQRAQFTAALASTIAAAGASVQRASDYIATRRNGVGRRARTRLAEAQASLDEATRLRDTDPKAAMDRARRADDLGDEAYALAQQDFEGWDRGAPSPARGGSDLGTAILGGIIGGILAGGGRHGGWGGSPWGGPFGGGGGGGGWGGGHSVGGGFGGFGGGGGGGGGHSVGGHW